MKRSEALERIQKYFMSENDNAAKTKAEIMLKFFEEDLEMEPPAIVVYSDEPDLGGWNVHTWEPED